MDCIMSYFFVMTYRMWMSLDYGGSKELLSASSIMGCYSYITQVWHRVALDDGPNVIL